MNDGDAVEKKRKRKTKKSRVTRRGLSAAKGGNVVANADDIDEQLEVPRDNKIHTKCVDQYIFTNAGIMGMESRGFWYGWRV